jgi:hypothetical protein
MDNMKNMITLSILKHLPAGTISPTRIAIENRVWAPKNRRNVKPDPDFHGKNDQRF